MHIHSSTSFVRPSRRPRHGAAAGFTLLETLLSAVILLFLIAGILTGLVYAYRLSAHTRYRDHARFVLKSLGDEFLVQQAEDAGGNLRPLFVPTNSPTGTGLRWQGTDGSADGMNVTLGTSTGSLITNAVVTRYVTYLSNSGAPALYPPASSAGLLLRGDFRISYQFNGRPTEQTLTLVRRVP